MLISVDLLDDFKISDSLYFEEIEFLIEILEFFIVNIKHHFTFLAIKIIVTNRLQSCLVKKYKK